MRNKYPGYCYACGTRVEVGAGYFEKSHGHVRKNKWRVKCVDCVIKHRIEKQKVG